MCCTVIYLRLELPLHPKIPMSSARCICVSASRTRTESVSLECFRRESAGGTGASGLVNQGLENLTS